MKINGIEWYIMFVSPEDSVLWAGDDYTLGVTDLDTKTIYIADDLDDETLYDVMQHEICHAWLYSMGICVELACEELICQIVERHSDEIQLLADKIYREL